MALSNHQIQACAIVERVASSISMFGTLMMFTAYLCFPRFRSLLSNKLLICASVANLACDASALMGGSGLAHLTQPLCQAQAFLLEWFMQTDPMIGMCMAFDVYLVIFRRWSPQQVKGVLKWYIPVCYGLPLIPALTCLLYRNKEGDRIFGNAAIWCWINNEYAYVRIYAYYGPVWIYLMVTFTIYIRVGIEIFRKRTALRAFGSGANTHTSLISRSSNHFISSNRNSRASMTSLSLQAFSGTRTTEVRVISTPNNLSVPAPTYSRYSPSRQEALHTVHIYAKRKEPRRSLLDIPRDWVDSMTKSLDDMDPVKVAYTKCASLFFLSNIITWVPSSANRVYGLNHTNPSYPLSLAAAAVLPLQGFWNTIIFFWISWNLVKDHWREKRRGKATHQTRAHTSTPKTKMEERCQRGININKGGETESTREVLEDDMEISTVSEDTRNSSVRTTTSSRD